MRWLATEVSAVCGSLLVALVCGSPAQRGRTAATTHNQACLPPVIFTTAPVYDSLAALRGGERFPQGAQLMVLQAGEMHPLVPELMASVDASVSFDGKTVLFAGKRTTGDPWQIWQVPAGGGTPQRVLAGKTDRIRPLWMPDGRMVYARRGSRGFVLETAALDGSRAQPLTFLPGNFIPDDVLQDGRVLFESGFPLGEGKVPELFLVYADGSGVESVRCDHPGAPVSGGREHGRQMNRDSKAAEAGDLVFTHGTRLARFSSPLAEEAPVAAPAGEYAGDVTELPDGRWLLAMRRLGEHHFALMAWQPGAAGTTTFARNADRNLVEPAVVVPRTVPNRHPSALHDWTFGNLLALDARQSRGGALPGAPVLVKAETLSEDGKVIALRTVLVEKDGSFFVQAAGDRPLRFILLDAAGHSLREEQGWFWVRRGEQRICVGCHTGPERAPENRAPEVLLRTTTPVDLTGTAPLTGGAAGGH